MSDISSKVEMNFHNFYRCKKCKTEWDDCWDSACDDECPKCGTPYTPYKSVKIKDKQ